MKVYLAATFARAEEMRQKSLLLEKIGYAMSCRWVLGHQKSGDLTPEQSAFYCSEDLSDLSNADLFIYFADPPGPTTSKGGRHVEFGVALADGKRIFHIGERENIFYHHPNVEHFGTWEAALHELELIAREEGYANS